MAQGIETRHLQILDQRTSRSRTPALTYLVAQLWHR